MSELPSLRALVVFEEVCRTGSFSRAAQELGVTQSAVSRQIMRLEEFLNVRLFLRDGRKIRLASYAAEFAALVEEGLSELRFASRETALTNGQKQFVLRLPLTLQMSWLTNALPEFLQAHTDTSIATVYGVRSGTKADDQIDAEVTLSADQRPGYRSELLFEEACLVVGAPDLLANKPANPDKGFCGHTLIEPHLSAQSDTGFLGWDELARAAGLTLDHTTSYLRVPDESVLAAARKGVGLAFLPSHTVHEDIDKGRLLPVDGLLAETSRGYYFCYSKTKLDFALFRNLRSWIIRESKKAAAFDVLKVDS
ncbi:LysR family transcriptional regulator [uncultured Ruegeria sp.]|uniref:LysR family transcriptional regulator n=1 Tax=uncultured Ruegeria sp. TaxID=259304 RepID=UPI002637021D|nr:LysR family transcriptional regulator [uncultured Ruegeria sp.]